MGDSMKAIVLSAGQGRRLLPLTETRPKCLAPLSGRSLLAWQLEGLNIAGVKEAVVVTGFGAEQVEAEIAAVTPRGMTVLAGGYSKADAREFLLEAKAGDEVFGVCSSPFLTAEFKTVRYTVAVKVLDVGGLPDWRDYERFRRQGEILGSLSHPRIPRALGDFEVGSRVLHCQTMVPGHSLTRRLRGARMTAPEVSQLAEELLEILDYLHTRDVVHRDVKPDNVVIADGHAHLVDFGGSADIR